MTDYSQNGEQKIILEIFGDFVGRFLEIGACDGKLVSNTLALVERGWSGVMVEPSPRAFVALQERHGANEKLTLVHAAVGLERGISKFWEEATIGGYSTTEEGNRAKWQHLAAFPQRPFWIPIMSLWDLVGEFHHCAGAEPGPIDFLTIDTEGTSIDLFRGFLFNEIHPRVVCVEHDGHIGECLKWAKHFLYREVARNGENLILVLE